MKKLNEVRYELTFSYEDDTHLDKQIYELLREIDEEADCRHFFTETMFKRKERIGLGETARRSHYSCEAHLP